MDQNIPANVLLDDYTLECHITGKPAEIDYDLYIADCLRSENRLSTTSVKTDGDQLKAALHMAIAMGAFIDLVKKAVVYGKEIAYEDIIKSLDAILNACQGFEAALHADKPDGYVGEDVPVNGRLLHAILGGYGENAELLEVLLNQIQNNGELKILGKGGIVEEAGDDSWYDALRADAIREVCGVTPGQTMTVNIAKLKARFPGKFTLEASENRNLAAEEKILTGDGK